MAQAFVAPAEAAARETETAMVPRAEGMQLNENAERALVPAAQGRVFPTNAPRMSATQPRPAADQEAIVEYFPDEEEQGEDVTWSEDGDEDETERSV